MKEKKIETTIIEVTFDELDAADRDLVTAARQAISRAYAPYSKFKVGAAIRLDDGTIIEGSNQENAAYPSGICAERTAAFYANSKHPGVPFQAIAIAAIGTDDQPTEDPTAPCCGCRQVLLEYEKLAGHPVKVILAGKDKIYILESVKALVPLAFTEF